VESLTYLDCANRLKTGDRVKFVVPHDIFAVGLIIEAGSLGTVMRNDLNEISQAIWILPDKHEYRHQLNEWDHCIELSVAGLEDEVWGSDSEIVKI
jgi:hypothetical protein